MGLPYNHTQNLNILTGIFLKTAIMEGGSLTHNRFLYSGKYGIKNYYYWYIVTYNMGYVYYLLLAVIILLVVTPLLDFLTDSTYWDPSVLFNTSFSLQFTCELNEVILILCVRNLVLHGTGSIVKYVPFYFFFNLCTDTVPL